MFWHLVIIVMFAFNFLFTSAARRECTEDGSNCTRPIQCCSQRCSPKGICDLLNDNQLKAENDKYQKFQKEKVAMEKAMEVEDEPDQLQQAGQGLWDVSAKVADKVINCGMCITNCFIRNLPGNCWNIFNCAWPCFTAGAPPEEPKPSKAFVASSRKGSEYLVSGRGGVPPIDFDKIINFAGCGAKCLISHVPIDPLTLVGFGACIIGKCVCEENPQSSDRTSNMYRGYDYWYQHSYHILGKRVKGSFEDKTLYSYDTGLSFK